MTPKSSNDIDDAAPDDNNPARIEIMKIFVLRVNTSMHQTLCDNVMHGTI